MLLLIAAASIATPVSAAASSLESRAFVRIERGVRINAEEWERASPEVSRRERIVKGEGGQPQLQRVIEHE